MKAALRLAVLLLAVTAATARAAPPQINLRVEMRAAAPSVDAAAPGDRVVDSRRGTTPAPGDFSVGTARSIGGDGEVAQVIVLNGAPASLRVSQRAPLPTGEWAWGGRDAGVAQSRVWIDVGRGFQVQPSWPGGQRPVALEIRAETSVGTTAQTKLSVPLGEWVEFAATAGAALQVRVSPQR
jgi:hypothetical protein